MNKSFGLVILLTIFGSNLCCNLSLNYQFIEADNSTTSLRYNNFNS